MPRPGLSVRLRAAPLFAPVAGAILCGPTVGLAQPPAQQKLQQFETWSGAVASGHAWSLYAGGNYAPFASITQDGIRLRAVAGYANYTYASPRWTGKDVQTFQFFGVTSFADVLAGYQKQVGAITIKVLGGMTVADAYVTDPEASIGTEIGAKAVIETWWDFTDRGWTSVDLSWATLGDAYSVRSRLGWRVLPQLSLGLEAGAMGHLEYEASRVGGFIRYEWEKGEVSASAGISSNDTAGARDPDGAFATLNFLARF